MNRILALLSLALLLQSARATPTAALPGYTYLYSLNESQALEFHDRGFDPEKIWHELRVSDSVPRETNASLYLNSQRKSGYYLAVTYTQQGPVFHHLNIPFAEVRIHKLNKEWRIYAYDSSGFLKDFRFQNGKDEFRYDEQCHCIPVRTKRFPKGTSVLRSGTQFLLIGDQDLPSEPRGGLRPRKSLFRWVGKLFSRQRNRPSFEPGFLVLNQTEFRHHDSLHAKAYLINPKGKPYEGPVEVSITNSGGAHYYFHTQAISFGGGAYGFDWKVPDSLRLDQHYRIRFQAGHSSLTFKEELFKVTHYTFTDIQVNFRQSTDYLLPGDSAWLMVSATDKNGIPLYGTSLRLRYRIQSFGMSYGALVCFPDSFQRLLRDTLLYLSPERENWIHIDPALLPNLEYLLTVDAELTTEDYQTRRSSHSFRRTNSLKEYVSYYSEQDLVLEYRFNRKQVPSDSVTIALRDQYFNELQVFKALLPYRVENARRYSHIQVRDSLQTTLLNVHPQFNRPKIQGVKTLDSFYLRISEAEASNLSWEIYYHKKRVKSGREDSLAIPLKGDEPVILVYQYRLGREMQLVQECILPRTAELEIIHNLPELAYPGQKIGVEVQVRDFHKNPVKAANLTGVSINTQMPVIREPQIPYYGPLTGELFPQSAKIIQYQSLPVVHKAAKDTFVYRHFELSRILYYRLYYSPDAVHRENIPSQTGATELQVVWSEEGLPGIPKEIRIDDDLKYLLLHNALQRNVFLVKPGYHTLYLRGKNFQVELDSVWIDKGKKTLVGVNTMALPYQSKIRWEKVESYYEEPELRQIEPHFLFLQHSLTEPSWLIQEDQTYELTTGNRAYYNQYHNASAIGPLKEGMVKWLRRDTVIRFYFNPELLYFYNGRSLETRRRDRVLLTGTPEYDARDFSDLPALTEALILEQWRIQDSIRALPPKVYPSTPYAPPSYSQLFDPYRPEVSGRSTLIIRQDAGFPLSHDFIWLENLKYPEHSLYQGTTGHSLDGIHAGWYRLICGRYQQQMLMVDSLFIDSAYLNFVRIDSLGKAPDPNVWAAMRYRYFTTLQRFGKNNLRLYDAFGGSKEMAGESKKSEVSGWVSVNLQLEANAYVVWINLNGKDRYITRTNSQGFFNQYEMEAGRYLAQVISPNRTVFFASELELKNGRMHEVNLNCVTDTTLRYKAFTQTRVSSFDPGSAVYTPDKENFGSLEGTVTESADGQALPYVQVAVSVNGVIVGGAVSDYNGHYRICCLKPGTYDVEFSYVGMQRVRIEGVLIRERKKLTLHAQMEENVAELNEVIIRTEADGISYMEAAPALKANRYIEAYTSSEVKKVRIQADRKKKEEVDEALENLQSTLDEKQRLEEIRKDEEANEVREDFRTNAFWVPNLVTDKYGKTAYTYVLPGDQTQWVNFLVAIDQNRNTTLNTSYTRSYKPLSASLVVPEFVRTMDSVRFTGKVRNLTGDTVDVDLHMEFSNLKNGEHHSWEEKLRRSVAMFYRNAWSVLVASDDDSLALRYSLDYQGYRDGEFRKVPILSNRVNERRVKSAILNTGEGLNFQAQQAEKRSIRINSGLLDLIREEIDQLKNYSYGCTEQTASKLYALLHEKQLSKVLGEPFRGETDIRQMIKRLEEFQHADGSWSWWKEGSPDINLTWYVCRALELASREGFHTKAQKRGAGFLVNEYPQLNYARQLNTLLLAHEVGLKMDTEKEIARFDSLNLDLEAYMVLCRLKMAFGQTPSLNRIAEKLRPDPKGYLHIDAPATWGFNSRILTLSLQAYELFRTAGVYEAERVLMKKGFFSHIGYLTRNTFQRAAILNTLATEAMAEGKGLIQVDINGKTYTAAGEFAVGEGALQIRNLGQDVSVILIEEQSREMNEPQSSGIRLQSAIWCEGVPVNQVRIGKICQLKVQVSMSEYRHYLVLEVPVPTGFQVMSKIPRSTYEVAREYYPDRIVLYFEKLHKGEFTFVFDLLPQFSGRFQLMPAFMEDMYAPEFFGMERKTWIRVQED